MGVRYRLGVQKAKMIQSWRQFESAVFERSHEGIGIAAQRDI